MPNESTLVGAIVRAVRKEYPLAWIVKIAGGPYQEVGIPDLLLCVDGLMLGIEVKYQRPGESLEHALARTTPGQRAQIARINRAGGAATTVTSVQQALDLIGRVLRERER